MTAQAGIQRQTISAQVAEAIRQRILSGEYAAGMQLKQEQIATEFNVSRIPVREALHQLHSQGFVQLISHKGAVVTSVSDSEILERFELRARVETWLLELAIPNMTAETFALARRHAETFATLGRKSEFSYEANWNFHHALYAPSGKSVGIEFAHRLHQDAERYTRMVTQMVGIAEQQNKEHLDLVKLCEAGETQQATRLLEIHLIEGGRMLLERLHRMRDKNFEAEAKEYTP